MRDSAATNMKVSTPELLWHGGGAENGKPDPVFSVDIFDTDILATAGVDENVPPKGSMRLWKIGDCDANLKFLVDLSDHQSTINVVRFSPCGKMIATASDRQIIIYSIIHPEDSSSSSASSLSWRTLSDPKQVSRLWLRPSLQEIYDLQWSPDSLYVVAGSIDSKGEILRVLSRDTISLRGHSSYVQGVAWDPLNQMVVTQSADRSCRIHPLKHKYKASTLAKVTSKGNQQIRMSAPLGAATSALADSAPPSFSTSAEDAAVAASKPATPTGSHLYADSNVPCFFRRPSFTPDGSLLITPTGIHRPVVSSAGSTSGGTSFCTHVFLRGHLQSPVLSLVGLEDPSVAVRCCPLLYELVKHSPQHLEGEGDKTESKQEPLFGGTYRMVFAVVTTSSVFLYDTQHAYPIARIGGCHLATINDAAWSKDGQTLVFCSSDGYLTFVRFEDNALGQSIPSEKVPLDVRQAFPHVYDYEFQLPVPKQQPPEGAKKASGKNRTGAALVDSNGPGTMGSASSGVSKKKRRITPTPLSTLPCTATPGSTSSAEGDLATDLCSPGACSSVDLTISSSSTKSSPVDRVEVSSCEGRKQSGQLSHVLSGSGTVATKKVKKRIAPVLLGSL